MTREEWETEVLNAIYAHEWKVAKDGSVVIDVPWLLRLLHDPARREHDSAIIRGETTDQEVQR